MTVKAAAQETVFDLTDAYSIMLTSESYTFNGNTSGVPAGKSCSTQVVSYLGGTPMKSNISKVTCPTGISVSLKNNNTITPTITFTTTATVKEDCEASIAVTVDDVTISKKFSFAVAKTGSKGDKGDVGAAGNGIKSISYYYARSSSQTAPSESSITGTSIPILDATNKYLWQKEVITFTNSTSQTTVVLLAVYGNTGAKGDKGNDGTSVTIKSQAVTYQASSSGTTIPNGPWSQGIPAVTKGQYLWTRTVITFSNDVTSTSYSVGYMGTNGQNGSNGSNGKDGNGIKSTEVTYQAWKDGITTPTGTWSNTPTKTTADNPYLWTRIVITYTDNTKSTSYSVGSTPEGIVVGGRNLLRNTAFKNFKNSEDIYVDNNYTKFSNNTLKLICDNTSGTTSNKYTVVASLKPTWNLADVLGQDITISMWIYIETVGQVDGYEFRITFTHNGDMQWFTPNTSYPVHIPSPSDLKVGWNYIYATFRIAEDSTEANFNFTCNSRPGKKSICWISSPKAEFGNKPTAWTPAPEDVDEGINNAQSSADKANTNASNAQNAANNAQDTANKADTKADQAKSDAASANTAAQVAKKQADNAQKASDDANRLANSAWTGVTTLEQVVKADQDGVKVLEAANSKNYAKMQSTGLHVFNNDAQVAQFGEESKMRNLAVQDYLMFGVHRAERLPINGALGTAFYWIGDIK